VRWPKSAECKKVTEIGRLRSILVFSVEGLAPFRLSEVSTTTKAEPSTYGLEPDTIGPSLRVLMTAPLSLGPFLFGASMNCPSPKRWQESSPFLTQDSDRQGAEFSGELQYVTQGIHRCLSLGAGWNPPEHLGCDLQQEWQREETGD